METKQLFDRRRKFWREKLVGFVHDKCRTFVKFNDFLPCEICYSARCADNDVNCFVQTNNVVFQAGAASRDHNIDAKVLAQGFADL